MSPVPTFHTQVSDSDFGNGGPEENQQLVNLLTQARSLAIRALNPDALKYPKADAMKLRQLLGEIIVLESKVHDAMVSGLKTTFLSLPREIRDQIYATVLLSSEQSHWIPAEEHEIPVSKRRLFPFDISRVRQETGVELNLLRVSKQVRHEAEEYLYKHNGFNIPLADSRFPEGTWDMTRSPRRVDDMLSLRNFHRTLATPAFDMIRLLEINLSSDDELQLGVSGDISYWRKDPTELGYLKAVVPQSRAKYARACATPKGLVLNQHLWLFAVWVNKLDHVFKMPALRELFIGFQHCSWSRHRCHALRNDSLYDAGILVPKFGGQFLAAQALMTRMRDRKKSALGNIVVTASGVGDDFANTGEDMRCAFDVLTTARGLWSPTSRGPDEFSGIDEFRASTADCDLQYSADDEWSCSNLIESDGFWWINEPFPVRGADCQYDCVYDVPVKAPEGEQERAEFFEHIELNCRLAFRRRLTFLFELALHPSGPSITFNHLLSTTEIRTRSPSFTQQLFRLLPRRNNPVPLVGDMDEPSTKRRRYSEISSSSDDNGHKNEVTSSAAPPNLMEDISDSYDRSEGTEDQWQLIDLLTEARNMAIRSLKPGTIKDRKAFAMKLKQLVGEVEVSEAKVHRSLVTGMETNFLSLPRELRDKIYAPVMSSCEIYVSLYPTYKDDEDEDDNERRILYKAAGRDWSLLRVTKQVRLEAREMLYACNRFTWWEPSNLTFPLKNLHRTLPLNSYQLSKIQVFEMYFFFTLPLIPQNSKPRCYNYIDNFDPQHLTKYATVRCTNEDEEPNAKHYLFAYWVNVLNHVFQMPDLRNLTINLQSCRWVDVSGHDKLHQLELKGVPGFDAVWMIFEVIMSRMRNRKRSNLRSVMITLNVGDRPRFSKDCFFKSEYVVSEDLISKKHAIWNPVKSHSYSRELNVLQASTADANLEYSGDEHWDLTRLADHDEEGESLMGRHLATPETVGSARQIPVELLLPKFLQAFAYLYLAGQHHFRSVSYIRWSACGLLAFSHVCFRRKYIFSETLDAAMVKDSSIGERVK
ncbi:hypothetical protein BU16DRAFT_617414 [Lophium mytilinum]|uniref:F-box domain-containing protein n=1 Tax=Lophium mytilinum TaxID=390894 RepID=A0A6A6QTZ8_9PEZI|nr:hypothetical protein BU16DRAFT_617414 [Lophium mytilinum]